MPAKQSIRSPSKRSVAVLLGLLLIALLLQRFAGRWLRLVLLYLSRAAWARQLVSNLGPTKRVARRFVAGETIEEAMAATRALNARGMKATLDYLGESVTDEREAVASRDEILRLLDRIRSAGVDANVSVKLSQLGLHIRSDLALDNMRLIVTRADEHNNRIRIDMEESELVDRTLELYRTLREEGFQNVGVVIQSYLYRSEEDVRALVAEGAWVRLCKGAYAEPPEIAFADKGDTDANFVTLMKEMISDKARRNGVFLGVATHDERMIQATLDYALQSGVGPAEYEFQMLYGIRREIQDRLVKQGYQLRIYVPYGTAWYPYLVRRLAERPANLWFFVTSLLRN